MKNTRDDASLEQRADLESGIRSVNERIDELGKDPRVGGWSDDGLIDYRCECGRPDCESWIRLTADEYDRLRSQDDRFAVALHHETVGLEGVVEQTDRYVVVDKLDQFERFVADDPRGAPSE